MFQTSYMQPGKLTNNWQEWNTHT